MKSLKLVLKEHGDAKKKIAEDAAPEVELTDDYVTEDAIARAWNKGKALGKYA